MATTIAVYYRFIMFVERIECFNLFRSMVLHMTGLKVVPPNAADLLVFIDNAIGRLMHPSFGETESAFDYMMATREYLEQHGKPLAFYSDKRGKAR